MDTDIDIAHTILVNGVNRAGIDTFSALNTQFFLDNNPASGPFGKGPGGADFSAGRRITGQTPVGDKTGGHPARRLNANPGGIPRYFFMHQTCAGQGA
jgi:hypothetical protein